MNIFNVSTTSRSAASNIFKLSATALFTLSSFTFSASAAEVPTASGEQKTLVFLVNFQENPNEVPLTTEEAHDLVFGTVNDFYKANSYGQLSLTGDVAGLFTAPFSNQICDDAAVADAVNAMAIDAGVPIDQYDRYIYLTTPTGCLSEGSATTSGLPSRTSVNGKFEPRVVAHELGHNLGLHHSSAMDCGDGIISGQCQVVEYGDSYDTMGNYDMGYYNTFQKERLGWMSAPTAPEVTVVEQDGLFTIGAYEQSNGLPVALKIPRGANPATGQMRWFYIEYRQSLNHDGFLDSRSYKAYRGDVTEGVVVRLATDGDAKSSRLLHMKPNSQFKQFFGFNDWEDPAMPVGASFTDPETGITIDLLSATGDRAEISVQFANSQCQMVSPSVTASPVAGQSALPGMPLQYRVRVENRDSADCGSADYQIQANVEAGWLADSATLSLSPGQSSEALITVSSPVDSVAGSYILPMVATQVANPSYSASDEVIYQVEGQSSNVISATDDLVILSAKQEVTINVMANDSVIDPASISISATKPSKGSAVVLSNGSINYTPANKFKNTDSFSYTISDGSSSSTAIVEIRLESPDSDGNKGKGKPN